MLKYHYQHKLTASEYRKKTVNLIIEKILKNFQKTVDKTIFWWYSI